MKGINTINKDYFNIEATENRVKLTPIVNVYYDINPYNTIINKRLNKELSFSFLFYLEREGYSFIIDIRIRDNNSQCSQIEGPFYLAKPINGKTLLKSIEILKVNDTQTCLVKFCKFDRLIMFNTEEHQLILDTELDVDSYVLNNQ